MASSPAPLGVKIADFPSTGISGPDSVQKLLVPLTQFQTQTTAALSNLSPGENMGEEKQITIQTPADDWIYINKSGGPSLQAGWTAFSATDDIPRIRKDGNGNVWMEGLITSATVGNNAFTLPAAYQPQYSVNFASAFNTGGTEGHGRIRIIGATQATPGTVGLQGPNPPSTYGSINCSFTAGDRTPAVLSCFPMKVACDSTKISQVYIGQIYDQTSSKQVPVSVGQIHWVQSPDGITILNIPGLLLGKKYQITLWILG